MRLYESASRLALASGNASGTGNGTGSMTRTNGRPFSRSQALSVLLRAMSAVFDTARSNFCITSFSHGWSGGADAALLAAIGAFERGGGGDGVSGRPSGEAAAGGGSGAVVASSAGRGGDGSASVGAGGEAVVCGVPCGVATACGTGRLRLRPGRSGARGIRGTNGAPLDGGAPEAATPGKPNVGSTCTRE